MIENATARVEQGRMTDDEDPSHGEEGQEGLSSFSFEQPSSCVLAYFVV